MRYAIAAILLLFSLSVFGQLDQFRMVGSGSWSVVDDSTYSATVTFASDLTANSFLPTGVVDSMRVFTQRGQLYTIDSVGAKTFSTAVIYAVEYGGNWGSPSGQVLVYETRGRETVPAIPFATNGATSKLQEAVVTHNAAINNGVSTTQLADSTTAVKAYTNNQIASVAPAKDTIVQASHGFSVGDPIWYSGDYLLSLDTGLTVRVDGVVSAVPDVNTFVLQRTGRFTLTSHGFTVGVQLYVQPDGSYSATDTSNTLVYGYVLDANTIEIGVKPDAVRSTVESRTFEFSRKTIESITRAKNNRKTWVVSDTVTISGNLNVSDLDIIFEKNGFIYGADTITANSATIQANPKKQLWSSSTVIDGEWNVGESYIEWSVGASLSDSLTNTSALRNALSISDNVFLFESEYRLSRPNFTSIAIELNNNSICITGKNRQNSVIVLTSRNFNTVSQENAYFSLGDGSDICLENLTVKTKDYEEGVFSSDDVQYAFLSCRELASNSSSPENIKNVSIVNCNIFGQVSILYASGGGNRVSSSNWKNQYIKNILIDRVEVDQTSGVLSLSNIAIEKYVIRDSKIKNMRRQAFGLSQSGFATGWLDTLNIYAPNDVVIITDNEFSNDSVITTTSSYASPVVFKASDFTFSRNKVTNILNAGTTSEVYPWYATGEGRAIIEDNTITDVFGLQNTNRAYLMDFKGHSNYNVNRNVFTLTKSALVSVGALDSVSQTLDTLGNRMAFQIFKINPDNSNKYRRINIRDNEISIPFANDNTLVQDVYDFNFQNNTLNIGYWGPLNASGLTVTNNADRLFYARTPADGKNGQYNWISKGNIINIDSTNNSFFYYSSGYGKTSSDTIYDFQSNIYEDVFNVNNTKILITPFDSKNVITNSQVIGFNSSIGYKRPTSNTYKKPFAQKIKSSLLATKHSSSEDEGFSLPVPNSSFSYVIEDNQDSLISVMYIERNDLLYASNDSLPLLIEIELNGVDSLNGLYHNKWRALADGFRIVRFLQEDGATVDNTISDSETVADTVNIYSLITKGNSDAGLRVVAEPLGSGQSNTLLQFYNAGNLKKINASVSVNKVDGVNATNATQLNNYVGLTTENYLFGDKVRQLTIGTVTNPFGGSNELGSVIDSLAFQYRTFTPIIFDNVDTLLVDRLELGFESLKITKEIDGKDIIEVTFTTDRNVTADTSVRLEYFDISASSYTSFGSGTIVNGTNQITVTGLTQTVEAGDMIYVEVVSSGGEANGISATVKLQ